MPYTCFVPFCNTGYKKKKPEGESGQTRSVSLFKPKTLEQTEKWGKAIPRSDRKFSIKEHVCELHFNPDDISWYYDEVKMPDGKIERLKRGKPKLSDDAVPSRFPNCPSYLSKNDKRRKPPTPRNPIIVKNRKTRRQDPIIPDSSSDQCQNNDDHREETPIIVKNRTTRRQDPIIPDSSSDQCQNDDHREETNHENQNSEKEEDFILNFEPPGGWGRHIIDDKIIFSKWSDQRLERHFVISKDKKMMFFLNNKRIKITLQEIQCSSTAVISKVFEDFSNIKACQSMAEKDSPCLGFASTAQQWCYACHLEHKKSKKRIERLENGEIKRSHDRNGSKKKLTRVKLFNLKRPTR